ncbi:MAG: hypothetical protein EXS38_03200 [Opitutus sp.]|nr:hypothetical protein [Opitutus sp.]
MRPTARTLERRPRTDGIIHRTYGPLRHCSGPAEVTRSRRNIRRHASKNQLVRPWCLFASLASAAWGGEANASSTTGLHSLERLQQQLEAFVTAPRFAGAAWGVKITSLDRGTVWFEHHADRRLSPASNTKLYTTALALTKLGSNYRIATPIVTTAPVERDGELKGDIIVGGRGDPSWNRRHYGRDFWAIFELFIAVLEHAGVRHVTGDLVADATYFRGPPQGPAGPRTISATTTARKYPRSAWRTITRISASAPDRKLVSRARSNLCSHSRASQSTTVSPPRPPTAIAKSVCCACLAKAKFTCGANCRRATNPR